jgi:hypothetical protein
MIEYIGIKIHYETETEVETEAETEVETEVDCIFKDKDITVYKKKNIDFEFIKKSIESEVICGIELLKWSVITNKKELLILLINSGIHKERTSQDIKDILKEINEPSLFKIIVDKTNYTFKFPKDNDILICFIKKNNIQIIPIILNTLTAVNISEIIIETCKTGNVEIFRMMTKKYKYKLTPEMLYIAIMNNNIGMVQEMMDNINYHDNNYKCLIVACEYGVIGILIYLLEFIKTKNPKSFNERNNWEGFKSLNIGFCKALLNDRVEVIQFMLSGKYSIEDRDYIYDIPCNMVVDKTTSNWLSKKGNNRMIGLLIKHNKLTNTHIIEMIKCNKKCLYYIFNTQDANRYS